MNHRSPRAPQAINLLERTPGREKTTLVFSWIEKRWILLLSEQGDDDCEKAYLLEKVDKTKGGAKTLAKTNNRLASVARMRFHSARTSCPTPFDKNIGAVVQHIRQDRGRAEMHY